MQETLRPSRRVIAKVLVPLYLTIIYCLPVTPILGIWSNLPLSQQWIAACLSPLIYAVSFIVLAGTLSLPHHKGIIAGKFPRDVAHPIYFHRRMYGLCWTALFYFKPIYYLALTVPTLKLLTFRLFGYKGQMDFTIYPDVWIRDLPLLTFGKGCYIANRATLGTNLALLSGDIMVAPIVIGDRAMIGHLTAMACDNEIGSQSEIGACCALGYKNRIGEKTSIAARCVIEHGVHIGSNCSINTSSYVGSASRLSDEVSVLPGAVVPPRTRIRKNENSVL